MSRLFQGIKLGYCLPSVHCRYFILNENGTCVRIKFHNYCMAGSPIKILIPSLARNFTIFTSLSSRNDEIRDDNRPTRHKTGKEGPKVSVIDDNKQVVMLLSDAEKLARRKKMRLVKLEGGREDKIKYKFEKIMDTSDEREQRSTKQKDMKRVILREETQIHDIEVKIKQIQKFLDKGHTVQCLIEGSGKKEKLEEMIQLFNKSKIKDCLTKRNERKVNTQLIFVPKPPEKKPEGEDEKNDKNKKEN